MGKQWKQCHTLFFWAPKSLQMVIADLIMKFLLKRRHLAPTHTSTLYVPDTKKDPLVIEKVPDFFLSGHIHKSVTANYRNTTLICGSCWQGKTLFQEKVCHNP